MVGSRKGDEVPVDEELSDPVTPSVSEICKKRKAETGGLSEKKRRDVINKLPNGALLTVPYTPARTPVSVNPNPASVRAGANKGDIGNGCKEKKYQWYSKNRAIKNLKSEIEIIRRNSSVSKLPANNRRWSTVGHAVASKKNSLKKRNSSIGLVLSKKLNPTELNTQTEESEQTAKTETTEEPDYVRISKTEYEEIKNKVSEIERRISIELDKVQSVIDVDLNNEDNANIETDGNLKSVQTAYEQTLNQASPMSPVTDHLARRLSKELKIRRNSGEKIIRSPSARKIGGIRRRSRELEKQNVRLNRNQSWHTSTSQSATVTFTRKAAAPTPKVESKFVNMFSTPVGGAANHPPSDLSLFNQSPISGGLSPLQRSRSFPHYRSSFEASNGSMTRWTSADGFFKSMDAPSASDSESARESLVKLRQNPGVVLAKAKLFDNLVDSDSSSSIKVDLPDKAATQPRGVRKIGSVRRVDIKATYRRTPVDENKKISPKKRTAMVSNKQKTYKPYLIAKSNSNDRNNGSNEVARSSILKDCTRLNVPNREITSGLTNRNVPKIKKPLNEVSPMPMQLCRTPYGNNLCRRTPLKVVSAARHGVH